MDKIRLVRIWVSPTFHKTFVEFVRKYNPRTTRVYTPSRGQLDHLDRITNFGEYAKRVRVFTFTDSVDVELYF